jgi:hypothetical protein
MTVRVNKSAFNIREKLSELERPIGVKGNELMRAETAQDARDFISAGRKNALYNGDMQIWQRGTTFPNGGGGGAANYTADRWNATRYASSENDVGREDANYLGFRYCLRSARGGGDTTTTARFVNQVLEQRDTWKLRGNYITFSFYLRVGSGFNGGLVRSSITYHTNSAREERYYYDQFTGGNNTQSQIEHNSVSTDWQRYTHTIYLPDNAQQVGVSIASNYNLPNAVSADYFEVTGCQLEVGKNATDFEHRSYGEELALCQRYFLNPLQNTDNSRSTYPIIYASAGASSGWTVFQVPFPVAMRVPPSLSHNISDSNGVSGAPSSTQWAFYRQNQAYPGKTGGSNMSVLNSSANTTQANIGAYYASPSSESSAILLGSDLTFHFSAEL